MTGMRLTIARGAGRHPRHRRGPHRRPRPTTTSRCSATGSGWPGWRRASPPTTPGWCPRSRRRWRRASSRGWSRWSSPPRRWPSGINMPARTVVIEKLSKFTGESHEFLTPGEYTQLTGRAGRRGIDEVGYAVVLWSPFVPFDQVAGLASTRTYALTSSFRPTYNMAVNLVRRYTPESAHHLLNLSFAQYRADRDVVRLERQVERSRPLMETARAEATCELGDVEEYRRRLRGGGRRRRARPPPGRSSARDAVVEALEKVKPGDVLLLSGGKSAGRVAVLSTARRRGSEVRLGAITPDRRYLTLSARDFTSPAPDGRPHRPARPPSPPATPPSNGRWPRPWARSRSSRAGGDGRRHAPARASHAWPSRPEAHPVADCPDVRRHLRAAERAERLEKDLRRLERRIEGRTESLARQFDRVLRVLEVWGYVDGWTLTDAGQPPDPDLPRVRPAGGPRPGRRPVRRPRPGRAGRPGVVVHLPGPAGVGPPAGEGGAEPKVWFPSGKVQRRWLELERLASDLNAAEAAAGLPLTRAARPRLLRRRPRVGVGRRPGRRHRRRGGHRRRLRPQRQAAHRPAAPARRSSPPTGAPPTPPARPPTACSGASWPPRRWSDVPEPNWRPSGAEAVHGSRR